MPRNRLSQGVRIRGVVVSGIWVGHAGGGSNGGGIRNRTCRGSTDSAVCLVGDLAARRHRDGVVNIAAAGRSEA